MRRILKIAGWICAAFLVIVLLLIIALQVPIVQNAVAHRAVAHLSDRLDTHIGIDRFRLRIPSSVEIGGLYIEDRNRDTLWYSETLTVKLEMFGLLRNRITVHSFLLDNVTANINRSYQDEEYNFEFIASAFAAGNNNADRRERISNNNATGITPDISVHSIELKNINARYDDRAGGDNARISLTGLAMGFDEIDPERFRFSLSHFNLDGFHAEVVQSKEKEPVEAEPGEPFDLDIFAGVIDLSSVDVRYRNTVTGDDIYLGMQSLQIDNISYSLPSNELGISEIALAPTTVILKSPKNPSLETGSNGIDLNDIHITDLTLDLENIRFTGETATAKIHSIKFREKSGFELEQLSAGIHFDDTSAGIEDLIVRTGASNISGSFSARYSSLESARENPGPVLIDLSLDKSFLGFDDVLIFLPELADRFQVKDANGLTIYASVNGSVDDLTIGMIDGSVLDETGFKMYGRVTGLPDMEAAVFDMTLEEIATSRGDIVRLVKPDMLPDNIVIPDFIALSGTYEGSVKEFETFVDIRTTFGRLIASMEMDIRETHERYKGNVLISDFDIGRLLDQPDHIGALSMTASIEGSGFDEETIDAQLEATIDHAYLHGYNYTGLQIDGRFGNRQFTGFAGMDDPNLEFRFTGDVQLIEEDPVFAFELDMRHADLHALGLMEEEIAVRVFIDADFTGSSVETINGRVLVRNILIAKEQQIYPVDSLVVTAVSIPGYSSVTVLSDFLTAEYEGNLTIAEVPQIVINHIDRYFKLHHVDDDEDIVDKNFTFSIAVHKPDLLSDILLPDLHELSPATIGGNYSGVDRSLDLFIDIPVIRYGSFELDSIRVLIESDRRNIEYDIRAARFATPSRSITAPEIYGEILGNRISTVIALYDEQLQIQFALATGFESMDTVYTMTLVPGELILNYEHWDVPEDNFIRFGGDYLYVHNLRLERGGSRIFVQSLDNGDPAPPIEITIAEFDISGIPDMIGSEELEIGGFINGNILLSDILAELKLNIDLLLEHFSFGGSDVGDIAIRILHDAPGRYDVDVDISRHDNRVHAAGYVITNDERDEIDLTVDIRNINLATLEGFTMGQVLDMSGSLTGRLTVSGSTGAPDINGSVTVRDASLLVTQLNSRFRFEDEVVAFDRNGISFRDVTIVDANNNRAIISGNILTGDFTDYTFALDIRSNNFMLMDTERRHNDLFYGRIIVDSDIRIRGDQNQPVVNASVGFKDGTNLTVVVPEQDPEVIERAGIVEFVKMDEYHQPIRDTDHAPDTMRTAMQGIDLTANIEVDPQTVMRVVIDEQAGDYVRVRGGGTLSFGIDPSGLVSIAGRYEFTDGAYQMTFYEVARRRFEIRPGSSIVWTGDPMDAEVDITAIYTVRASAVDLVADQVGDEARQQYRRALPFQVYLNMSGKLLSPDISFALDMPEDQRGAFGGVVYQQIQRVNEIETERNKQVFALLVLNRFLPENPFDLGEGAGLTATARTSASKLLTQQLNALSGRYIRGIDIQFDVESYEDFTDEGPVGRTELQLQVSQRFLDDRLVVEVGGQFDLEGERARQTEISDIAGDVAVEYVLTKDGRFRLRGFRKTEYGALGDGEVIFTGLSLVYAREFNRFIDLLRRPRPVAPAPEPGIVGGEEQ